MHTHPRAPRRRDLVELVDRAVDGLCVKSPQLLSGDSADDFAVVDQHVKFPVLLFSASGRLLVDDAARQGNGAILAIPLHIHDVSQHVILSQIETPAARDMLLLEPDRVPVRKR